MDCLELCLALAHADDVSRELFLGGGDGHGNINRLARLVDLRGGEQFRDKGRNAWWREKEFVERKTRRKKKSENGISEGGEKEKSEAFGGGGMGEGKLSNDGNTRKGGKRGKKAKDDDLDDILRGAASTTSTTATAVTTGSSKTNEAGQQQPNQYSQQEINDISTYPEGPPTPFLTPNETNIVDSVFNLILVLLYDGDDPSSVTTRPLTNATCVKRRGRAKTIMSHDLT